MNSISIIAIDGPAASGKSTLGKKLADDLGFLFFDTGVMYRAITWLTLQHGIGLADEAAITKLAETTEIDIRPPSLADGRNCDILAQDQDMTWDIRRPIVDANVSQISAYAGVRKALSNQQRRIGLRGRVVMVGRDIGTVVLPEADLKIFLDATTEERAHRRTQELLNRGEIADYQEILEKIRRRDEIDSTRDIAPLKPADDAVIIASDEMDVQQVFETVRNLVKQFVHHT